MSGRLVPIHVRVAPDGAIVSHRALRPRAWVNRLSLAAGNGYRPFAGARGVFRMAGANVEH
jgi:hypothetical protein